MKIRLLAILLITGMLVGSERINCSPSVKPGRNAVGFTTREFYDNTRSNWLGNGLRPLRIDIWYPAQETSGKQEMIDDPEQFTALVKIIRDGAISSLSGRYPVVLISHGSYGNSTRMRWLAHYLAAHGYISVAINHNGNAVEEKQLGLQTLSEFCMWERPRDVTVVLDKMLEDPVFSQRIDTNRIGVAGFSLGGATAIWTGGAILNIDSLRANAPQLPPEMMQEIRQQIEMTREDRLVQQSMLRAQNSYHDLRIKAIFALAPAIGFGFTREGLKGINVPVQIVVGDQDLITPMASNSTRYYQFIKNAKLIVIHGERGHYTQNAPGNKHAAEFEEVSSIALKFFQESLR
jgi:predicted dienelactone hydrolase